MQHTGIRQGGRNTGKQEEEQQQEVAGHQVRTMVGILEPLATGLWILANMAGANLL